MGILSGRYTIPLHHRYSKGLIALIVRCLEPDPDIRPSSFQVLHDLDKLLGETTFDHGKNNSVNNGNNIGLGKVSPKQLLQSSSENKKNHVSSSNEERNSNSNFSHSNKRNKVFVSSEMNDASFDEDNVGWASFSAFQDDSNV